MLSTRRQAGSEDVGTSCQTDAPAAAVLMSDECQTMDSAALYQWSECRPSAMPAAGGIPSAAPRVAFTANLLGLVPVVRPLGLQPLELHAEARRERAGQARSAAAVQRAFDAWLDMRTTHCERLAAAASLWTAGTLRGAWTRWQAEHRQALRQVQTADQHAASALSRRAAQVRISAAQQNAAASCWIAAHTWLDGSNALSHCSQWVLAKRLHGLLLTECIICAGVAGTVAGQPRQDGKGAAGGAALARLLQPRRAGPLAAGV